MDRNRTKRIGARVCVHLLHDAKALQILKQLDFVIVNRFNFFERWPQGTIEPVLQQFSDLDVVGYLALSFRDQAGIKQMDLQELLTKVDQVLRAHPTVKTWNLANEVFVGGQLAQMGLGPDWLAKLFDTARTAAPHAELMLNEYAIQNRDQWDAIYTEVQRLKRYQLIDTIGIQLHSKTDNRKFSKALLQTLPGKITRMLIRPIPTPRITFEAKRFKELGLKVHLSECSVEGENELVKEALYLRYAKAAIKCDADAFSFWHLFDGPPNKKGYQDGGNPGLYKWHNKRSHTLKPWGKQVMEILGHG